MTTVDPGRLPERIALLPGSAAQRFLTRSLLTGEQAPPAGAVDQLTAPWEGAAANEAAAVRDLVNEAKRRHEDGAPTVADAWLAPRLHSTLRMTRRDAADPAIWNFLALRLAPDYVQWRHRPRRVHPDGSVGAVVAARYSGPFHTQAFSRLWWAAELFRDGADYVPVVVACENQDVLNTVLRLEFIHHRPAAQAMISLLQRGVVTTGREVNALAAAVNAAGGTLSYESLSPDHSPDRDAHQDWINALPESARAPFDRLPDGPPDGGLDLDLLEVLAPLFSELFQHAPVRGKSITGGA
jgi:hypothetical protein